MDPTSPHNSDYASPAAALIDLADADPQRRGRATHAFCSQWSSLRDAADEGWRELGERGQMLVPGLVRMIVTEKACTPVEVGAMVLGLQGEDGLTELLSLAGHDDWMVRWSAGLGFELAGSSARWAVPTLIRRLRSERVLMCANTVVQALGKIGGREAIEFLNSMVWDRAVDSTLRSTAVGALREAMSGLPDLSTTSLRQEHE